ncbi:MAG: TonB-dependent receptor plug domain-containing protein [Balneolaceae bacterium]
MVSFLQHSIGTIFLCLALLCLSLDSAQAQDQTESSDTLSVVLDAISVEAAHSSVTLEQAAMSVSRSLRTVEEMTSQRASSMNEITWTLPGIWINNRENHALGERMTIRGMGWRSQFGVRGIQVVMDDIPLTVADGQSILNIVDPAMIRSVELLRGPSATFWGNSSGGVLFLRTRPGSDAPVFKYRTNYGSYNTIKQEAQFSKQINGIQWNAYGTYHKSNGFRAHNESELIRGGLSADINLSPDTRIEAKAAYSGMPYAQHPGSLLREEADENPRTARQNFADANAGKSFDQLMGAALLYQDFDSGLLTVTTHATYRDLKNPLPFSYITVGRLAGGARATFDVEKLPFDFQIGSEVKWQRDNRWETNFNEEDPGQPGDTVQFDQLEKVSNQALFAQAVIPTGKLSFSLGLRADRMNFSADDHINMENGDRDFLTLNPSFGLIYKLNQSRLFVNVSTSFESPTTTEFKNRPGGATGFNKDLNPERTIGIEAGNRGVIRSLDLEYDVTLFGMRVQDLIIPFDEDEEGRVYYRNEGNTIHTGLESWFRLQPIDALSFEWMYTYLHVKFLDGDYEGNNIPGVAPHRFSTTSTLYAGNHRLSLDLEWVGDYFLNSSNTSSSERYALLNGRWLFNGLSWEGWSIQPFVSVHNIFNENYTTSVSVNAFGGRYFEPGSHRSFHGGLSINFH